MLELISDYIGAFITILSSIVFVKYIVGENIRIKKSSLIICLLAFTVFYETIYLLDVGFVRTLIGLTICILLFKFTFEISGYKSVLLSFAFIIMLVISEVLVFLLLNNILKVGNIFLYDNFVGSILGNFIVALCCVVLGYIFRGLIVKIVNIKVKNDIVFYVILIFICIIFFFYITFSNIGKGINIFSGIAAMTILLSVVINLLIQSYKNNELTIKYDRLLDFIKKYEVEIDCQRTMRHELKNQLLTIKSKIIDKDNNKNIIGYIDEIIEDNNREINHTVYAKLNYLPHNGLKGLFYFKVSEAIEKGINVNINISKNISDSILSSLNSTTFNQVGKLFGILLDNSIESAEMSNDKKIGIEIYIIDEVVNFVISNTFVGNVTLGGVFTKSLKGENRGHGLLLAKAIIASNDRFHLDTTVTDKLYIQKLSIK